MSDTTNNDREITAVEKALGEPIFSEFSDKTWRIRTNLLIVSVISIAVVLSNLHIEPGSTVFGLKFAGLTDEVVRTGLFWVTTYLIVHFIWGAWDNLLEWRVRVTGTRLAFVTAGVIASEHADYPNNPKQSTLYSWWKYNSRKIGNIGYKTLQIEKELEDFEKQLRQKFNTGTDAMNIVNACSVIGGTRNEIIKLTQGVAEAVKTIEAKRIPVSLKRFDNWFQILLRSQNLRWLVLEFFFPVLLAAYALFLLKS